MKKFLLGSCLLGISSLALADFHKPHTIEGQLGMNSGQVAFGVDYEYRLYDELGVGGLFLFATGDDDKLIPEVISFAAAAKIHLLNTQKIDFYSGPGLGIAMVEVGSGASKKDETAISPLLKTGAFFKVNENVGIGASHLVLANWSVDDFGPLFNTLQYILIDVQVRF